MSRRLNALTLFRVLVVVIIALSLALTLIAIAAGVPYRLGGSGEAENVGQDAFLRGSGISAPIVFLIVFGLLLALSWLPGRWRAVPIFLAVLGGAIGIATGIAEIALGGGPFAHDIGPIGVVLWISAILSAAGIVILGLIAGVSSLRAVSEHGRTQAEDEEVA
jgi:hypothetical protein